DRCARRPRAACLRRASRGRGGFPCDRARPARGARRAGRTRRHDAPPPPCDTPPARGAASGAAGHCTPRRVPPLSQGSAGAADSEPVVRILIVDDDAAVRSVIETMLQNTSAVGSVELSITTAEDGEAGLAAVAELTPDVVIVDLLMPRLDGFQTCKALRSR